MADHRARLLDDGAEETGGYRVARSGDRPEDKLPRIAAPVLVIHGDRDAITTSDWAKSCARLAPDGRYVPIRGAAHAAHFSHPQQVARLVLSFVSELADHRH